MSLELFKNNEKEVRINSVELVDIINQFRQLESELIRDKKYIELKHKDIMKKIRKEVEVLQSLGLDNGRKISPVEYVDAKGEKRPCYSLNRDGMLQMLNSESVLVRHKTIEYINKLEDELSPKLPKTYKEALIALVQAEEEKEKLQLENAQQKQLIGEYQPKVDYVDEILKSTDTLTVTQISKDYGLSAQELNSILNDNKVQYKQNGQWLLYSKYQECGYTKSETFKFTKKNGDIGTKLNSRWTQKGRLFINDLLKKNGIVALIEQ